MSINEMVASSKSGKVRMSRTSSDVNPRLPAPMNVILVMLFLVLVYAILGLFLAQKDHAIIFFSFDLMIDKRNIRSAVIILASTSSDI